MTSWLIRSRHDLFHKAYRHLYGGEKREQETHLEAHMLAEVDKKGTTHDVEPCEGRGRARHARNEWRIAGSNR